MDLLIVLAFIAAAGAVVCFAAGMLGDCVAACIISGLFFVAAVGVAARKERSRR
jgi:hypothetical protein